MEARWVRGERADAAETLPRLSLQATWLAQHTCNSRKDSPKSGAKIQSHASITSGLVPPRRAWESRTRAPASDQGNSTAASEAGCAEERGRGVRRRWSTEALGKETSVRTFPFHARAASTKSVTVPRSVSNTLLRRQERARVASEGSSEGENMSVENE